MKARLDRVSVRAQGAGVKVMVTGAVSTPSGVGGRGARLLKVMMLFVALAFAALVDGAAQEELPLVAGETYQGVIIPVALGKSTPYLAKFDGFWQPSTNDIAVAEAAIAKYIEAGRNDKKAFDSRTRENMARIYTHLKDYRRQYVGVYVGPERRVLCNVLSRDEKEYPEWRRRYVRLVEGCPDCWRIRYAPETGECLVFNADYGY
jgi:hypothetical protein